MKKTSLPDRRLVAILGIALLGTACASLHPPERLHAELRKSAPVIVATTEAKGAWPEAGWWKGYGDPTLDQLIDMAIGTGPTIAGADARIRAAEQDVRVAGAALGLSVTAQASYTRQRLSDNGMIPPDFLGFHWYDQSDLGVAVRYQFDWWGKQQALIEGAIDRAHASAAETPGRDARPRRGGERSVFRLAGRQRAHRPGRTGGDLAGATAGHREGTPGCGSRQRRYRARCEPPAGRAARRTRGSARRATNSTW